MEACGSFDATTLLFLSYFLQIILYLIILIINMDPSRGCLSGGGGLFNAAMNCGSSPGGGGRAGVDSTGCPYGITPVKYFPSGSSSIGRNPSEGWRYGAGYLECRPKKDQVYGEPDYKYYRQNYCGPCGCGPSVGNRGDPNGCNPNIRYIQLDYNNLVSGFAQQGVSATSPFKIIGNYGKSSTGCSRANCGTCKPVQCEKPTKFQVHIGKSQCGQRNEDDEGTICVPNSMLPVPACEEKSDGENCPEFEIQVPDCPPPEPTCPIPPTECNSPPKYNPCDGCKACKEISCPPEACPPPCPPSNCPPRPKAPEEPFFVRPRPYKRAVKCVPQPPAPKTKPKRPTFTPPVKATNKACKPNKHVMTCMSLY